MHTCQRYDRSCSTCSACKSKRAEHLVLTFSGTTRVVRCGHCDGPQAHAVRPTLNRAAPRLCQGDEKHERHVLGAAAA